MSAARLYTTRAGTRLSWLDHGGDGPPALLLHGLAGHAGEWDETASWLVERQRVLAPDARGHGHSERNPADVSREAHVADVAELLERLGEPAVLIGHSLGSHTAFLTAARRPELVAALVVAEGSADGDPQMAARAARALGESLRRWPVPFASRAHAIEFFGGESLRAEAWANGLEQARDTPEGAPLRAHPEGRTSEGTPLRAQASRQAGGLRPRFEVDVMERTLRAAIERPYWEEWARIRCPTLVVRAGRGISTLEEARAQAAAQMGAAQLAEIADSGHDVHLEAPAEWRAALSPFLEDVPRRPPGRAAGAC